MVLVNFSMAASTCFLRRHAWEYFMVSVWFCFGGLGDSSVGEDDGYASVLKIYFWSQQLRFGHGIIITSIPTRPLPTLTGDNQYFKLGGGVLYHSTSGQICHAPGQDPHTQMMTSHSICSKDFCDPWYTHPKKYYPPSAHFASIWIVSVWIDSFRAAHHRQSMTLAVDHRSHNSAQPVALITAERMWKMWWKRQKIGS